MIIGNKNGIKFLIIVISVIIIYMHEYIYI